MRSTGYPTSKPEAMMRPSLPRALALTLIVVGVLGLAYSGVVLLWKDPATSLYAHYEQNRLEAKLAEDWHEPARMAAVVQERRVAPAASTKTGKPRLVKQKAWKAPREGNPIGWIKIPKIGLSAIFLEGITVPILRGGPGHYPMTSMPDNGKVVAIAGHRTTYGAPFRHLDSLTKGDVITLRVRYGTFRYRVTGTKIVASDDWSILDQKGEVLVLTACHPLYSAEQRIVVFGRRLRV